MAKNKIQTEQEVEDPKPAWAESTENSEETKVSKDLTFNEFISNTTLHGVRHIFDRDIKIRK